jgi:hypothetical protein
VKLLLTHGHDITDPSPAISRDVDDGFVVQNGSYYIGIDGETTALGLNIFGHDCFAAGTAVLIRQARK